MHVLIVGSLGGELGKAARIAQAHGAKLHQADNDRSALAQLRADARVDLLLVELPHDVAALLRAMEAERFSVPIVACGTDADAPMRFAQARQAFNTF